jgi:hypothetical protein
MWWIPRCFCILESKSLKVSCNDVVAREIRCLDKYHAGLVRSEPLHDNNIKFLHIPLANKGIDAINISNILKNSIHNYLEIMFPIGVLRFSEFRTMRNHLSKTLMLCVFPLFMKNMLSFLRTRLPTISCLYVSHITSNA